MHPLASGVIGAGVLTALHESARHVLADPPRMDLIGMRALARGYRALDLDPPDARRLHRLTLAGDILSNGVYYSAVSAGRHPAVWTRALVLGMAAGLGALLLPEPLGLGPPPHGHRRRTQALTVALYLSGALAAAAASHAGTRRRHDMNRHERGNGHEHTQEHGRDGHGHRNGT